MSNNKMSQFLLNDVIALIFVLFAADRKNAGSCFVITQLAVCCSSKF